MSYLDTAERILDRNGDGRIDANDFRDYSNKPRSFASTLGRIDDDTNRYSSYGSLGRPTGVHDENTVNTSGPEETARYLERAGVNIFRDPNPRIVRRATSAAPITAEQRVTLRCLRPPTPPPPGPLIIKEVRPPQPPLPPPLVIREQTRPLSPEPPLYIRERPPQPPPHIPSETKVEHLPAIPVPPRSLVIERYPAVRKPRDIIIERWLPYGPRPERQVIRQREDHAVDYPPPTHTIVIHEGGEGRTVQKLERLGVSREDPEAYLSRYGNTLLDAASVLQQARNAGVTEDISCFQGMTPAPVRPTVPSPVPQVVTVTPGPEPQYITRNVTTDCGCKVKIGLQICCPTGKNVNEKYGETYSDKFNEQYL